MILLKSTKDSNGKWQYDVIYDTKTNILVRRSHEFKDTFFEFDNLVVHNENFTIEHKASYNLSFLGDDLGDDNMISNFNDALLSSLKKVMLLPETYKGYQSEHRNIDEYIQLRDTVLKDDDAVITRSSISPYIHSLLGHLSKISYDTYDEAMDAIIGHCIITIGMM